MIVLITVPHTGTTFFSALFKAHGIAHKAWHATESAYDRLSEMEDPHVVVTERDWDQVIASWDRRGKPTEDMIEHRRWYWRIADEYDADYVSVDDPMRRQMLDALGDKLGVEFKTDWKPANTWKELT